MTKPKLNRRKRLAWLLKLLAGLFIAFVLLLHGVSFMFGKRNLFEAIVVPNYNHFIPWQHPDAVERAIQLLTNRLQQTSKGP